MATTMGIDRDASFEGFSDAATSQADGLGVDVIDGPDRDLGCVSPGAELTVGTASENDLVLTDPSVSPYHLWLHVGEGILVRDLGSRAGTFLGGVRIREAIVPLGARLRLGNSVIRVVERAREQTEVGAREIPGLVAVSAAMRQLVRNIERLARSDMAVLVQGETGTGKELVSRALHDLGPRAGAPYVIVDVGALSPTLVASQLFGHERGAFTGADTRQAGAFEQASGGSILLDEIGELPAAVQPALLGVLERRTFRRLGGKEEIKANVRVIAATHRDLHTEVQRGTFRQDLYFRIAGARINIPPLRERAEDLGPLVEHFARQVAGEVGVEASSALAGALRFHTWPGNVRELRNVIERAFTTGSPALEGLIPDLGASDAVRVDSVVPYRTAREAALGAFERAYLSGLMGATRGNAAAAARLARMDRSYLLTLLRKVQMRPSGGQSSGQTRNTPTPVEPKAERVTTGVDLPGELREGSLGPGDEARSGAGGRRRH